ncbi:glycosyltransferase family 39 protein [Candidatus Woesebacteria bacterium]|nr:glycosyltransferase family 39 protein [Candidatus Woesebacteria bacterium]
MTTDKPITNAPKLITVNWFLILILLLSAILRIYKLNTVPPHLTPDEAALGYNAYSILKTGKDEYGKFMPLVFKSFGDYKPGLYVYLTVPFVALIGLNEYSVRLASAMSGIISVYLIYLIVTQLFKNKKLALISALVSSLTPWLIYLSRGAWEVNVSLTLTLVGIYLFFRSFDNPKLLSLSGLSFALTLLTYQGAKLSTGIVIILLLLIYFKQIVKYPKKVLLLSAFLGIIVSTPIVLSIFRGQTGRLNVFSVFNYPRPVDYLQNFLSEGNENVGDTSYYVFHSELLNFSRGIMGRWFNHFSGRFLFFEGDWANPRHTAPNQGVLLLSDVFFVALGFGLLIRNQKDRGVAFILLWLILSPLPAILSRDQVHAVRSLNMSVPLIMMTSIGVFNLYKFLDGLRFGKIFMLVISSVWLGSFIYFLDAYFIHLPIHNSKLWEYGYKQVVEVVSPIQSNYKQIKIRQSFAQPYIYILFYQKYDPAKYQRQANLVESPYGDVGHVDHLDNICFCAIDWSIDRGERGTLFVSDPMRIPPEDSVDPRQFKVIKEIKYLDDREIAFRIIGVK